MKKGLLFLLVVSIIFISSCAPRISEVEKIAEETSKTIESPMPEGQENKNNHSIAAPVDNTTALTRNESITREPLPAPEIESTVIDPEEHSPSEMDMDRIINPGGTIIHQQDGLYFAHYFPNTGSLKGDESEILVYHQGTVPLQITSSDMKFMVEGRTYDQYSGTWEKFPSFQSWEKIEYINIKPPYYQGQPLILEPGQKGKLHWHYRFAGDIWGKEQKVKISVEYKIGTASSTLNKEITRQNPGPGPSEEGPAESNSGSGQEAGH